MELAEVIVGLLDHQFLVVREFQREYEMPQWLIFIVDLDSVFILEVCDNELLIYLVISVVESIVDDTLLVSLICKAKEVQEIRSESGFSSQQI